MGYGRIALALVLACPLAVSGDDPPIPVASLVKPQSIPEGGSLILDASGSTSLTTLVWRSEPPVPILTIENPTAKPPQRFGILVNPRAGRYLVTIQALSLSPDGKQPIGDVATVEATIDPRGTPVTPPVTPPVNPPVNPPVVPPVTPPVDPPVDVVAYTEPLYAVMVYDQSRPSIAESLLTYRSAVILSGLATEWCPYEAALPQAANYVAFARSRNESLPVVYLTDARGKVRSVVRLDPSSTLDTIVSGVKKIRGIK